MYVDRIKSKISIQLYCINHQRDKYECLSGVFKEDFEYIDSKKKINPQDMCWTDLETFHENLKIINQKFRNYLETTEQNLETKLTAENDDKHREPSDTKGIGDDVDGQNSSQISNLNKMVTSLTNEVNELKNIIKEKDSMISKLINEVCLQNQTIRIKLHLDENASEA